jgi:hypothetical protein
MVSLSLMWNFDNFKMVMSRDRIDRRRVKHRKLNELQDLSILLIKC